MSHPNGSSTSAAQSIHIEAAHRDAIRSIVQLFPPPMEAPPGFPPELLSRALKVAEFFHVFQPVLNPTKQPAGAAAETDDDVATLKEAPGRPTAYGFMSALSGTDVESFVRFCGHLRVLLNCLRVNRPGAGSPPIKKRYILELAYQELMRSNKADGIRRQDYDMTTQYKLRIFEELMQIILDLPKAREYLPKAQLEPLAIDWDGTRLWWLSCAPDCILAESRTPASAGETWRCYSALEDLLSLRQSATDLDNLSRALDHAISVNRRGLGKSREQQPQPGPSSQATNAMPDPISEYLRSKFTSRLIGCAELLHADLPRGSCISFHRLRHYLAGSTRPSELADCLLQFEGHLKPDLRPYGIEGKIWRERVSGCDSFSRLNLLLDELLIDDWQLVRNLGGRRGVCADCFKPVNAGKGGDMAFCYACCRHFHQGCAVIADDAARSSTYGHAIPGASAATAADAASISVSNVADKPQATDEATVSNSARCLNVISAADSNLKSNATLSPANDTATSADPNPTSGEAPTTSAKPSPANDTATSADPNPTSSEAPTTSAKPSPANDTVSEAAAAQSSTSFPMAFNAASTSTQAVQPAATAAVIPGLWKCAQCLMSKLPGQASRVKRRRLHRPEQDQIEQQLGQSQTSGVQPAQHSTPSESLTATKEATLTALLELAQQHLVLPNSPGVSSPARRQSNENAANELDDHSDAGYASLNCAMATIDQRSRVVGLEEIFRAQTCQSNSMEVDGSEGIGVSINAACATPAKQAKFEHDDSPL